MMRERKRKHDDAHIPFGGTGKRAPRGLAQPSPLVNSCAPVSDSIRHAITQTIDQWVARWPTGTVTPIPRQDLESRLFDAVTDVLGLPR
jgi:hypothetical protein